MLTTIENTKQTILPTMRSDIDGWQLDGVNDWELAAIFEDENDYETEQTTQGLVNETEAERHQLAKMSREDLIDLYMWRVENGYDMFTGEDLGIQSQKDDEDESVRTADRLYKKIDELDSRLATSH